MADFRTAVAAKANNAIESVGPTRSVAVSEGTPDGVQAPWGPGKGQLRPATKKGDVSEGTAATTTDPREGEQWDMQMINVPQAHTITTGSPDVTVGVLDSGIDPDHPDSGQPDRPGQVGRLHRRRPTGHRRGRVGTDDE
ncbi:hypothetical protein LP422_04225 [Janibacter limosus]|uniref:Uncharacterized protein n=1 Tax=Janibacter limosus TaxID=53458 RepID=A0AC61U5S6_9MICO|nr:hypothetical protein [Janibacter limosus]UUZ45391.1 hypothetical protein LP422_04225 [Janibacter limosus]